ncbi:outer membrane protein assembly factor BamD, partial [Bacteroidota bacterium]
SVLVLSSCSEYNKLLKSGDYELKLTKAKEFYNIGDKKSYSRAETLLEELTRIYRADEKAEEVLYYYAKCYYGLEMYVESEYYFGKFAQTYPRSKWAEECNFLCGYSSYLESPSASLDQSDSKNTIEYMLLFIRKFPNSTYVLQCNDIIDEMRDKLVEKSYISAKLYYNMGEFKASIVALNSSINEYPETKYKEEILFLILKSYHNLAINSVISKQKERHQSTVDQYFALVEEFPETTYLKEAQKYYNNALLQLK